MQHRDRSTWPGWVRVGLWGIHSRGLAWFFVVFALALAAGSVAYAYAKDPLFAWGGIFVLSALWYFLAIRWVDEHAEW